MRETNDLTIPSEQNEGANIPIRYTDSEIAAIIAERDYYKELLNNLPDHFQVSYFDHRNTTSDIDLSHKNPVNQHHNSHQKELTRLHNTSIINSLTDIELGVIKLLCEGNTLKQIARIKSRSPHTIDKHIRHIFEKTSIHKVQQLTLWAKEVGLV